MPHCRGRRESSEETRKKIIAKYVQGKGQRLISKQLEVPVAAAVNIVGGWGVRGII